MSFDVSNYWLLGCMSVLSTRDLSIRKHLQKRTSCKSKERLWQLSSLSIQIIFSLTFLSQIRAGRTITIQQMLNLRQSKPSLSSRAYRISCLIQTFSNSLMMMLIDSQDSLKSDLTSDKPLWPLSTFGPAKYEPNLVSNFDESMEELRLRAVIALKAGNVNEYVELLSNDLQ